MELLLLDLITVIDLKNFSVVYINTDGWEYFFILMIYVCYVHIIFTGDKNKDKDKDNPPPPPKQDKRG